MIQIYNSRMIWYGSYTVKGSAHGFPHNSIIVPSLYRCGQLDIDPYHNEGYQ